MMQITMKTSAEALLSRAVQNDPDFKNFVESFKSESQ